MFPWLVADLWNLLLDILNFSADNLAELLSTNKVKLTQWEICGFFLYFSLCWFWNLLPCFTSKYLPSILHSSRGRLVNVTINFTSIYTGIAASVGLDKSLVIYSQVPQLYCIQLGLQYPKNSKIWLWLLPQPTLGNALVEVDKNWNISGLLSGFQLEKLFFIHTVRSYSHSTATAEFVKATARFVFSSEASDQLYFSHFSTFRFVLGNIFLFLS